MKKNEQSKLSFKKFKITELQKMNIIHGGDGHTHTETQGGGSGDGLCNPNNMTGE